MVSVRASTSKSRVGMSNSGALKKAKESARRRFARRTDVLGIGIAWQTNGMPCLKVLLMGGPRSTDPDSIGGVPVLYEVTGKIAKRAEGA